MNSLIKKILFLSPLITVSSPVIFAISCGNQEKEKEYTSQLILNESKVINNTVIEMIDNNLFNSGLFLPELSFNLNKIIITDDNYGGLVDEAVYIPETKEIIISTKYFNKKEIISTGNKVEYITELIHHEYNHFLAHEFLKNIDKEDPLSTQDIYKNFNNKMVLDTWNKNFIRDFKSILNYDHDTPLYDSSEVAPGFISIGSLYNQKNLFDISNGQEMPSYPLLRNKNAVMAPLEPSVNISDSYKITGNALSYIYSMDELFVRKLQIISYPYQEMIKQNLSTFTQDGWIDYSKNLWTPYLEDILNYKRSMKNDEGTYLQDAPTERLINIYKEYILPEKVNISFIKFDNDKHIRKEGSIEGGINYDKVSFGGLIPNDSSIKIGFMDKDIFHEILFETISNSKQELFYRTKYIDPSSIIDKSIVYKIGDIITPMSLKNHEFGDVSTFEYMSNHDKDFKFININSQIKLLEN